MQVDLKWLKWQVALPLIVPTAMPFAFSLVAWTTDNDLTPKLSVLLGEATPWAWSIYALTLIAMSLRDMTGHPTVKGWLIAIAGFILVFYAHLALNLQQGGYVPPNSAYGTSLAVMVVSIVLCYIGRK